MALEEEERLALRELEEEPMPILVLATPKTMWKVNWLHNKISHAAHRQLRCREPSCNPDCSVTIRTKDRDVLVLVRLQYRFGRMSIWIGGADRHDCILRVELLKPVRIQ